MLDHGVAGAGVQLGDGCGRHGSAGGRPVRVRDVAPRALSNSSADVAVRPEHTNADSGADPDPWRSSSIDRHVSELLIVQKVALMRSLAISF